MPGFFNLLLYLYPASFRRQFAEEMRGVFVMMAAEERPSFPGALAEVAGLIRGAVIAWIPIVRGAAAEGIPISAGVTAAVVLQALIYAQLLRPHPGIFRFWR